MMREDMKEAQRVVLVKQNGFKYFTPQE
jgi:hypothetical protein